MRAIFKWLIQIKNKQKCIPKDTHHNVSALIDLAQNDLSKEKTKKMKNRKPNLSKGEQQAMEELAKRKNIIIISADKGVVVRIMGVETYMKQANRKLPDKNDCKTRIPMVNDTIDRFKKENLLSKKLADALKSVNPQLLKYYSSPKIQKENNPGSSMIKSINCHISEISRFVDHHLKLLVREIQSYIKDEDDFIKKIIFFLFHLTHCLLQWTSSHYT